MKKEILLQEPTTANGIIAKNNRLFDDLRNLALDLYVLDCKCNSILS